MLDNLRDQATFQEDEEFLKSEAAKLPKPRRPRRSFDQITGMTAQQRFGLVIMLALMVCVLGAMFLFLSGKMVP